MVSNITVRWKHVNGTLHSERGHFCFHCGRPFHPAQAGEISLRSIRVPEATPAMRSLQASGDVILIRYRSGATEVLF